MNFTGSDFSRLSLDLGIFKRKRLLSASVAIVMITLLLQACGQKGDLYLPVVELEEQVNVSSQQESVHRKKETEYKGS